MNRRVFLSTLAALPVAAVVSSMAMADSVARSEFAFGVGAHVVIVTDLNRGGTIIERMIANPRSSLRYPAYLVRREFNGACEWYPGFVLA